MSIVEVNMLWFKDKEGGCYYATNVQAFEGFMVSGWGIGKFTLEGTRVVDVDKLARVDDGVFISKEGD